MVSRRNYFTITIIFVVVFFLFQFTNVALEIWNDYETNEYVINMEELPDRSRAYSLDGEAAQAPAADGEDQNTAVYIPKNTVAYIGSADGKAGKTVYTWAAYSKRNIMSYESLGQFENEKDANPGFFEMAVIDPGSVDWDKEEEIGYLENYVEEGIHLIFTELPDVSVLEANRRARSLFGIRSVKKRETTVTGIHLYEGFLLGGETIYETDDEEEYEKRQDMDLTFPWYTLGTGTKAYMKGIPKDKTIKLEEYPALIWRKSFKKAYVFAVNGGYMEDMTGLGILSAMSAEMDHYEIYPVVNGQSLLFANYPGFAQENGETIVRLYGQPMAGVLRDVIWPSIVAVHQRNNMGLSCMMTPQYDYDDENEPKKEQLLHFMKLMNEREAEVGLSGISISDTPLQQKLSRDYEFMQKSLPGYEFSSFYGGGLTKEEIESALETDILNKVRTVVKDYDGESDVIGYESDNVTRQGAVNFGLTHTYRDDLRMRSVETALGYSSVLVDMNQAAYPGSGDETWKDIAKDLGWNIQYYWKPFGLFSPVTVSGMDGRIRNFLALNYTEQRNDNILSLEIGGTEEPVWFLLRTHDETIGHMEGGSWQRLERNVYLIEAESETVTIELKSDQYFYLFGS